MGASPENVGAQPPHRVHSITVSNGIMERWIRTLKEKCLYLHDFQSLEEARRIIGEFIMLYNEEWLLERHGHLTPAAARQSFLQEVA